MSLVLAACGLLLNPHLLEQCLASFSVIYFIHCGTSSISLVKQPLCNAPHGLKERFARTADDVVWICVRRFNESHATEALTLDRIGLQDAQPSHGSRRLDSEVAPRP